ncbi:hypothetical protein C8R44DRAFT_794546 [Mycena epipterygia]|nr:hypothetical protein C8R44DRAFT_794546 [Mycena epipterygia]
MHTAHAPVLLGRVCSKWQTLSRSTAAPRTSRLALLHWCLARNSVSGFNGRVAVPYRSRCASRHVRRRSPGRSWTQLLHIATDGRSSP